MLALCDSEPSMGFQVCCCFFKFCLASSSVSGDAPRMDHRDLPYPYLQRTAHSRVDAPATWHVAVKGPSNGSGSSGLHSTVVQPRQNELPFTVSGRDTLRSGMLASFTPYEMLPAAFSHNIRSSASPLFGQAAVIPLNPIY